MLKLPFFLLMAVCLILAGCGENGEDENGGNGENGPVDTCEGDEQEITFVQPEDTGSVPVYPCTSTVVEDCFQVRATFCRAVEDRTQIEAYLENDGDRIPGSIQYRQTDLAVVFRPFAILESQSTYTAVIVADGVEETLEVTTVRAHEGEVADMEGMTFAFGIEEFLWPEQLTSLFNNLRSSIPDNLINVNEVSIDPESSPDDQVATVNMVGAAAELGSSPPELIQEDHEGGVFTSTGLRLEGSIRGDWFIIGPAPVSLVASGVPFVVREFVASGVFSEDGDRIEIGYLTGFLNIEELGEAVGQDLSSICTASATKDVCDDDGNARLAGRIGADPVDIGFDCFITSPVNKSIDNEPAVGVEVYCTHPLDETTAVFLEVCDDSEDAPSRAEDEGSAASWSCYLEEGEEIGGVIQVDGKLATFTPEADLVSGVWYRFGIDAVAADNGESTTRHAVFRVQ